MANPFPPPPGTLNPHDVHQQDFLRRQQDQAMRDAERARDLQRQLDRALPGKPFGHP